MTDRGADPDERAAAGPDAQDGAGGAADTDRPTPSRPPPEPERRLSPLTMVTAPINYLKGFLVPIVIAVVAGSFNPWVLASAAGAIALMLLTGFVTWRTFRYQVGSERVEIRRGLVNRSRRTIPLERIRGVDVTSQLLHRMLGLAVVRIEAAAGGGTESEEGKLDAVSAGEAERLRRVLLHRRAVLRGEPCAAGDTRTPDGEVTDATATGPPAPAAVETVYFSMPRSWYFYAVLSLGYLLTPFAALATLIGVVGQSIDELHIDVRPGSRVFTFVEWLLTSGLGVLIAVSVAALAVLVLLMPVFAVVSYTVAHWGFTLRGRDSSLVTERGLFTRRSVTLERRRIRGYELLDNPLERLRGAVRLRAVVTGLGQAATRAALLPIGDRTRVLGVVERALTPYRGGLAAHPRAALGRRLFRAVLPPVVAAAIAAAFGLYWGAGALCVLALLAVPLGVDRYRSLGHGDDGHQVSVRSGSLRRQQVVVRRDAIIGWTWSQTLFQRRSGLADLELAVGAGDGGYTAIDAGFADAVRFAEGVTPAMVRPFLLPGEGEGTPDPAPRDH